MVAVRENGENNIKYLREGNVGCMGLGNKKAMRSIDEIFELEKATFKDALYKWGVDETDARLIEPIVISGPCGDLNRIGKDWVYRSDAYMTYILGFTDKQILMLIKRWNVRDMGVSFTTEELFYKDVISITVEEGEEWNRLTLQTAGLPFASGLLSKSALTPKIIQGARNLLREKKDV